MTTFPEVQESRQCPRQQHVHKGNTGFHTDSYRKSDMEIPNAIIEYIIVVVPMQLLKEETLAMKRGVVGGEAQSPPEVGDVKRKECA